MKLKKLWDEGKYVQNMFYKVVRELVQIQKIRSQRGIFLKTTLIYEGKWMIMSIGFRCIN